MNKEDYVSLEVAKPLKEKVIRSMRAMAMISQLMPYYGVELTDEQYRMLSNRGRTFLYASRIRHKNKKKFNGFFRLTIIFYFIWTLFLSFVVQPIKWVITGNVYFSTESWAYKFTIKWMRKVGL